MTKIVKVYRNLHNGKLSVKDKNTGLVLGHCDSIALRDAFFNVNQNGIKRIRQRKRKEVVATVEGEVIGMTGFTSYKGRELTYTVEDEYLPTRRRVFFNPYKYDWFVTLDIKDKGDDAHTVQSIVGSSRQADIFSSGTMYIHDENMKGWHDE